MNEWYFGLCACFVLLMWMSLVLGGWRLFGLLRVGLAGYLHQWNGMEWNGRRVVIFFWGSRYRRYGAGDRTRSSYKGKIEINEVK